MSIENNSTLKIMALGRPFQLGILYDYRTDKLIPNISLWNSNLSSEYINCQPLSWNKCQLYVTDMFTDKADLLGIDNNLKISVLANLIQLSGSAKLINDRKKSNHILQFILKYSIKKHIDALTMTYINKNYTKYQEVLDQQIATHIVTDILYGGEIFFLFDRKLSIDEDRTNIENCIKLLLKKFETFQILDNDELNWNDHEKKLAGTLTCQYYGDFQIQSNPTTFKEIVKLYKELSKSLNQNTNNIIPKQVWIYPLYLLDEFCLVKKNFYEINNDIVIKILELFDNLYQLEEILNDLKISLSSIKMFYRTEQKLLIYLTRLSEIEIYIRNQMMQILPKIRNGSMEEITLIDLMKNLDLSSSNKRRLNDWIQFKIDEINIFKDFGNDLSKQDNIHLLLCSFDEVKKKLKSKFILRLIIHITDKNDLFLNEIFQYFNNNITKSINQYTNEDYWFNKNNFLLIQNQISLFIKFAQANYSKSNIEFIVNEEYADEFHMNKGVTSILYQNNVPINFEIPSRPGQPYATNVTDHSLTLKWSKPIYGSQSIQQYKIYSKNSSNYKWNLLLTTVNATLSIDISNLIKGKYQFKVQGTTLVGDTPESDVSNITDVKAPSQPVVSVPTKIISKPTPIVTPNQVTTVKATVDVTPAWFEPVKSIPPEKIRFPANYNKNSPKDVRTYSCLSTYRSMVQNTKTIDFVANPFLSNVDNTETLVVVLNELAYQLGAHLTFTQANFKYNDSDYRTACGVTNLGSIHSFLASEGNYQTAKFDLHFTLNYDDIIASPKTLQNFVLRLINDICSLVGCDKDFVRVFSVKRTSSSLVEFGFTTTQRDETEKLAKSLKQQLNKISIAQRPDIFQYLFPEEYDYKLEPALAFLQLQQSDFEVKYNRYYSHADEEIRGGYPYHFPQGWHRHALKVDDKYPNDKAWLGMNNSPGEWAVAYHGTISKAVKGIKDKGLLHSFVTTDAMKDEAKQQNPSIPDVKGLYVATHCEGGAANYTMPFEIKDNSGTSKDYRVVFQCRVQPGKFTVHASPVKVGRAWRVFDEKAIRPYGLLLKSSETM
ncbi:unnamed protein product [Rotaria sordida]|uniref:Fibronectin type-III domain-containing protein n=1 Tax=Rotaria sordida TaxID=392033 RepID=A0A814K558_9BILA|nr:unnamed protein product [Rotaria sordida]CAF3649967.1 unnamed protein product [Rotaria sordida]